MLREHSVITPEPLPVLSTDDALSLQSIAARVHVEEDIRQYAVELSHFTRNHPKVVLGASPRATLALIRTAKSNAVLQGRPYASPDDVQSMAQAVLAHRLILVPELEDDKEAQASVIAEALSKVSYRRAVHPV